MKLKSLIFYLPLALLLFSACRTNKNISGAKPPALSERDQIVFSQLFFDASKEKIIGNYPQALALFNKCLLIDRNSGATMYEMAALLEGQDKTSEAIALLENAVKVEIENQWYKLFLAQLYEKENNFNEAIKIYKELLKKSPDRLDYRLELANAFLLAGKAEEAIKIYDKIEAETGISEEISFQKEKLYIKLNELEKAAGELNKLIKAFPGETKYFGMLAELYQANGKDEKAFEIYSKILETDPNNPYINLSLAEYYQSKGEKEKSFNHLKKAFENPELEIDNKIRIMLSFYGISENNEDLKSQAYELCGLLVKTHPSDAKSHSMYGDFLSRDKKLVEARESFRKAIALENDKYPIWNQLFIIESELNDYTSMQKESDEALELFPAQPMVYLFSGLSNMQLNKFEKSIANLNSGLALIADNKPLKIQFHTTLGDVHFKNKNNSESDKNFETALQLDPLNTYVLNNYSYYLSLRGDSLEKAAKLSELSNNLDRNNASFQDTYGWILYKQKKFDLAKEWIEKAITSGGASGAIFEHYGDILFQLNMFEKAMEYWIKAKSIGGVSEFIDKKISDKKLYE